MIKVPSVKKMSYNSLNIKKQILKNEKFLSYLKTWFSIFLLLISIWVYGYFVNISSTKWYFLKQERYKLSDIKFQNEIVKIDVRKIEGNIFDNNFYNDSYNYSTWKVFVVKESNEFVYNK